jgi:sulfur carrier protein ThiS
MRIILKVSSNNEYCNGGCEFALVDLTSELAALALRRVAVLREQKSLDPDIDETYYWAHFAHCYFDPYADLAIGEKEAEGASVAVEDLLDELQIEENEIVCVPESFRVPPSQVAGVECEQMIVRQDSIAFTAIPKHASFHVQTAEIPLAMLEAAAGPSALRARV